MCVNIFLNIINCRDDLSNTPGPSTPFPSYQAPTLAVEEYDIDSGNSSPACTSSQLVSINSSSSRTRLPSRSPLGSDTSLDKNKRLKSTPMSVNQAVKKTKFSVCEDTATSASYHVKERRLKVLLLAIQVRRELGVPFEASELPNDLHELLFNLADKL